MAVVEQTSRCHAAIAADGGVGSDRNIGTSGVDVRHPAGKYGRKDHQRVYHKVNTPLFCNIMLIFCITVKVFYGVFPYI